MNSLHTQGKCFSKLFFTTSKGSARQKAIRESEVHANAGREIVEHDNFGKSIKDMPIAILTMLKNPTFLFTTLAGCSDSFIVAAFTAFLPKCLESQFNLTASDAAYYSGKLRYSYQWLIWQISELFRAYM